MKNIVKKDVKGFVDDVAGYYVRDSKRIKLSFSGKNVYFSVIIYKDGTFDYKSKNTKKEKIKNTLEDKYNYESIKNFVEDKRNSKSKSKISEYLYNIIDELPKSAGIYAKTD